MPSPEEFARNYHQTLMGLPQPERVDAAMMIEDMTAFEDMMLKGGCPLNDIDELMTVLDHYRSADAKDESIHLLGILSASIKVPDRNYEVAEELEIEEHHKPRFPTSVPAIDDMTKGGGYGVTTVGGAPKCGKTMFAIGTAIEAARLGWRVIYINAELDSSEIIMAVMRYCRQEVPGSVKANLTIVSADFTFSPADAIARVTDAVRIGDSRILIVLDSINALVDLSSDGQGGATLDYWAANSLWRNFALRATRQSKGRLAFLVVSEINKEGGVKGKTLEYKSDLVIRIRKDEGNPDENVEIDVALSRDSRAGNIGTFYRKFDEGRFVRCE